jgi:hypothetical protein
VVGFGGLTMVGTTSDWEGELGRWLKPFLDRLGHKTRRPEDHPWDRMVGEAHPLDFIEGQPQ